MRFAASCVYFCLLAVALSAQQLTIVDPVPDAFVSGDYEVVIQADQADAITKLEVLVDGQVAWQGQGFQPVISIDFGEEILARRIQVRAETAAGQTWLSEVVQTRALKVDLQTTTRMILIPTVVKDRRDRPIKDLKRAQFEVLENGKPAELRTLEREDLPLDLVLMLDTSSSLREDVETLKIAAKTFLQQLETSDRVAVYEFKREINQLTRFSNDRKAAMAQIDTLFSRGETALFDALERGLRDLGDRHRGRRALILFTDGRDSVYEDPRDKANLMRDAIQLAQNREVTIYTLGLGDKIHEPSLERIAEETGGRFLYTDRASGLGERFAEIVSDLKNQYVLGMVPQATRKGFHRIDVKVKVRGAKIYARKGYTIQ